jgi:hypothetical protein
MIRKSLSDAKELKTLSETINQRLQLGESRQEIFTDLQNNYKDHKTLGTIIANVPTAAQVKANQPWRNTIMAIAIIFLAALLFCIWTSTADVTLKKKVISTLVLIVFCAFDTYIYYSERHKKLFSLPPLRLLLFPIFISMNDDTMVMLICTFTLIMAIVATLHYRYTKNKSGARLLSTTLGYEIVEDGS